MSNILTGNVQQLGLGIIEKTLRGHERVLGVAGLWEGVKPYAEQAVKEMLPGEVNIHPGLMLAWQLWNRINEANRKSIEAANGNIDIPHS